MTEQSSATWLRFGSSGSLPQLFFRLLCRSTRRLARCDEPTAVPVVVLRLDLLTGVGERGLWLPCLHWAEHTTLQSALANHDCKGQGLCAPEVTSSEMGCSKTRPEQKRQSSAVPCFLHDAPSFLLNHSLGTTASAAFFQSLPPHSPSKQTNTTKESSQNQIQ
ncbi:hypothetical protein BKA80DRAFT_125931 [Phyllosticta citrichinensis]